MILTVSTFILAQTIPADAAPNNFISVIRSDTCKITQCIKLANLIQYDNSSQAISGKFVYDSTISDYTRKAGMKNAHNYYQIFSNKTFVFVEPDQSTISRSKVLVIEKQVPAYATKDYEKKNEVDFHTDTRTIQYDMWFDRRCHTGITSVPTIPYAISYMKKNCQGDLGNKQDIITKKEPRTYCGKECQHQKFMKAAKEAAKRKLITAGKA